MLQDCELDYCLYIKYILEKKNREIIRIDGGIQLHFLFHSGNSITVRRDGGIQLHFQFHSGKFNLRVIFLNY